MKKNYFMLAATTMMLAACAQTDVVNEIAVEETPQAIGFETFANKQTRATENSSAAYSQDLGSHHETFEVYAYKNVSDQMVFNNEEVSINTRPVINNDGTVTPSTWKYNGQVYWDKAATEYNFYAAAPAADYWNFNETISDGKVDQTKSYFTINSYEINDHNATVVNEHEYVDVFGNTSTDLMIASKEQVTSSSTQALFQPVQLDFIHILSRLNITVSKDASLDDQVVTLNSLTVYNVSNIGSFNENAELNSTLNEGTYERWNPTNNVTSYTSLLNEELTTAAQYMLQSLVIPQPAEYEDVTLAGPALNQSYTKPYFKITYTIKEMDNSNPTIELSSEEFTAYYNLANAFGLTSGSLAFNEGWQNTLNITIKPTAIEFTGKVATWAGTPGDKIID